MENIKFLKKLSLSKSDLLKCCKEINALNEYEDIDINKTWHEQGFYDLDLVELMMEIELHKDLIINDDEVDMYFQPKNKPIDLLIFETRSERLKIILNS